LPISSSQTTIKTNSQSLKDLKRLFKSGLKLVVNNFIDRLSQENFVTVLNAIHMYASNKANGNINNNLIAIGMFQNVADYTAKQIIKKDGS